MTTTGNPEFDLYFDDFASLVTSGQIMPAWSPDGKFLAFIDGPTDQRRAWLVEMANGDKTELVDTARLREEIRQTTGETPPGQGVPFAHLAFVGARTIAAQVGTHTLTINLDSYTVTVPPSPNMIEIFLGLSASDRMNPREYLRTMPLVDPVREFETMSPDGRYLISTRDGDVVLRSSYGGRDRRLTTDGTPEHEWRFDMQNPLLAMLGLSVPVANWSNDGTRVAAYKVDHHGVYLAPQVHYLEREDEIIYRSFSRAGGVLERHTLHLLDVNGQSPVTIDLGDTTDTYPCFAGWLPGDQEIVVFRMSRDCRRVEVLVANAETGDVRELFSEEGDTFVRLYHDVVYARKLGLWISSDAQKILWLSERTGWRHLWAYDLQGNLLGQLTDGDWAVEEIKRIDETYVYFTARHDPDRPYDVHLCRAPLAGGATERLTEGTGVHEPVFSPLGDFFIDACSAHDLPPTTVLRTSDGDLKTELSKGDTTELVSSGWVPPQQFTVTAADGKTELWGVMYFPKDFDASQRYPVVEYVYGGPQIAVAPHGWGMPFAQHGRAIAQLGYITILLDARGTPGRSKAFHDTVYGNFADALVDDHAGAIQQLAERHDFVDGERVAAIGHSWGAYSAVRLLEDRPDVYRAAVSVAPGLDPYSSVLYECYLGLPQQNKQAYEAADPFSRVGQIEGALMIAAGTSDHATWSDALKMSEALIRVGKDHDFVVLPGQYHSFDTAHDSYFWRKVDGFFKKNLGFAK